MLAARVIRTLEEHSLLERGDRVLCALSGGADSTALLHVMLGVAARLGVEVEAATVDHGLRPESAAEAERAVAHARSLGATAEVLTLSLAPGPGTQERARAARYERLAAHAAARGVQAIAVGHTLDDQAETVIARLLRGAGLRGLAGVLRRREDGVIRPLLDCTRAEVESYLAHHRIVPSVEDPSNRDARFQRVRVRTDLLPALARESGDIARTLAALADEAGDVRDWLGAQGAAELAAHRRVGADGRSGLDRAGVARLAPPLRREVLRLWGAEIVGTESDRTLGRAHLEALDRVLLTGRGDVLLPGGVRVRNDHQALRPELVHGPEEAEAPVEEA